jgi:hypothetical protein
MPADLLDLPPPTKFRFVIATPAVCAMSMPGFEPLLIVARRLFARP